MLGLILVYIFVCWVCLAIDYHHPLLHLCHAPAFEAEQLYLSFCRGSLIMSFESSSVTSRSSWEMPFILFFGCLEVEGYIRYYTSSKSRRYLLVSMPCLDFLAANHNRIYSCEKSVKFCESMNIYPLFCMLAE